MENEIKLPDFSRVKCWNNDRLAWELRSCIETNYSNYKWPPEKIELELNLCAVNLNKIHDSLILLVSVSSEGLTSEEVSKITKGVSSCKSFPNPRVYKNDLKEALVNFNLDVLYEEKFDMNEVKKRIQFKPLFSTHFHSVFIESCFFLSLLTKFGILLLKLAYIERANLRYYAAISYCLELLRLIRGMEAMNRKFSSIMSDTVSCLKFLGLKVFMYCCAYTYTYFHDKCTDCSEFVLTIPSAFTPLFQTITNIDNSFSCCTDLVQFGLDRCHLLEDIFKVVEEVFPLHGTGNCITFRNIALFRRANVDDLNDDDTYKAKTKSFIVSNDYYLASLLLYKRSGIVKVKNPCRKVISQLLRSAANLYCQIPDVFFRSFRRNYFKELAGDIEVEYAFAQSIEFISSCILERVHLNRLELPKLLLPETKLYDLHWIQAYAIYIVTAIYVAKSAVSFGFVAKNKQTHLEALIKKWEKASEFLLEEECVSLILRIFFYELYHRFESENHPLCRVEAFNVLLEGAMLTHSKESRRIIPECLPKLKKFIENKTIYYKESTNISETPRRLEGKQTEISLHLNSHTELTDFMPSTKTNSVEPPFIASHPYDDYHENESEATAEAEEDLIERLLTLLHSTRDTVARKFCPSTGVIVNELIISLKKIYDEMNSSEKNEETNS